MTTADALEPYYEQAICGQAELIVRSWRHRTMDGISMQHLPQDAGKRGRDNSLKARRKLNGK